MKSFSKTRSFLLLLFGFISLMAGAQNISVSQAEDYARRFFDQYPVTKSGTDELRFVWNGEDPMTKSAGEAPAFYVFNRGNNNGFVIIAGNKGSEPILAYSYEGSFAAGNMPENVRYWMQVLKNGVRRKSHGVNPAWNSVRSMTSVMDLHTNDWDQGHPYNQYCPRQNGVLCPTGCAITAASIVMAYHRWPDRGVGTLPSYIPKMIGSTSGPITLGHEYRWNDMDPQTNSGGQNVAVLMRDLGVLAKAEYSADGTGASINMFELGLPNYMKYDPEMTFLSRSLFSEEEWSRMLKKEINENRPVMYQGFGDDKGGGGHGFVLDGYDNAGFFNINWGWGGYFNGYYNLDNMAPSDQGTGGNTQGQFNYLQGAVFSFQPSADGSCRSLDDLEFVLLNRQDPAGLMVDNLILPARKGDKLAVRIGYLMNEGLNMNFNNVQLAITDHEGNVIESLLQFAELKDLPQLAPVSWGSNPFELTIHKEVKPGYRLRLLYSSEHTPQGELVPVFCNDYVGDWEVILNDGAILPPDPQPENTLASRTSFRYDKTLGKIIITKDPDAEFLLEIVLDDGNTAWYEAPWGGAAQNQNSPTITIDCAKMTAQYKHYRFHVKKGGETVTCDFMAPAKP